MGYTHYYGDVNNIDMPHKFSDEQWDSLCETARAVVRVSLNNGIPIQWEYDKEQAPQIDDEVIRFNGVGGDGHETFLLEKEGAWRFCKTAYKPYDAPVVAMLLAAQAFGLIVSSDGSDQEDGRMSLEGPAFQAGGLILSEALQQLERSAQVGYLIETEVRK